MPCTAADSSISTRRIQPDKLTSYITTNHKLKRYHPNREDPSMKSLLRARPYSISRSVHRPPTPTSLRPLVQRKQIRTKMASTFTIPFDNPQNTKIDIPVTCPPTSSDNKNISKDQLLAFPAFKTWLSSLHRSLAEQTSSTHEFHNAPYKLRKIDIQAVDYFGAGRLGFVKMKAEVSNDSGESLPGSILLRGGSVAMLVRLVPSLLDVLGLKKVAYSTIR